MLNMNLSPTMSADQQHVCSGTSCGNRGGDAARRPAGLPPAIAAAIHGRGPPMHRPLATLAVLPRSLLLWAATARGTYDVPTDPLGMRWQARLADEPLS
jgi:hypothetical protein